MPNDSRLIDTAARRDDAIEALAPAKVLAVDTEFLWERTYAPRLALVQVAGVVDERVVAFAFDPLEIELDPLDELFGEPERLKVFHAGRLDLELLNLAHDEPLEPVFDTQIAASLLGYGSQIGYANLVEVLLGRRLDKAEQFADWTKRPLRPEQLDYALDDVIPLLEVYARLAGELLERERLSWLQEEQAGLSDPETYRAKDRRELYKKVKGKKGLDRRGLARLRELTIWREETAERRDLRPSFVVKDHVLADIARRNPRNQNQLKQVRGLHKNEISRNGKAILSALERARKLPDSELPSRPKRPSRKGVGAVVDLLKAYLRQASEERGVAVETLTTSSELERLVRDEQRERYADDHPLLRGWRRELVGEDLLQILGGKRYLAVEPGAGRLRVEQAGG